MINMTAIKKKDRGVTLIELMIVLVIAAVLVAGVYSLFITQHRSYAVQDQVVGVQQDARAALDIMGRDIRMAGFGVGAGSGTGFTDGTGAVVINGFSFAVNPTNRTDAPDTLTVVLGAVALGTVSGVTGNTVTLTSAASTTTPVFFSFDLLPGRLYQGTVNGTSITMSAGFPSGTTTIVGGRAYGVQAITYSVTALNGSPGLGVFRRNENTGSGAQPLAGDGVNTVVEDLQFAYQVEGVNYWTFDGVVDTDNGETDDTALPFGKSNADIRMIRINIIVKTAIPDPKETGFVKPACEDHGQVNSDPGNRRRVYTTVVKVRNL